MKKFFSVTVLSVSASLAVASQLELIGQVGVDVPVNDPARAGKTLNFKIPKYNLSSEIRNKIKTKLQHYPSNNYRLQSATLATELPPKVDLGMEGTPVLNQGAHGSCATFAITAAIDATLGAGDYISQLCSLELGASRAINDEIPYSGWNGSWGSIVLNQLMSYGVVTKNHEQYHGCANVKQYPIADEDYEGQPMDAEDYKKVSVPIHNLIEWDDVSSTLDNDPVWAAKESLAKGRRLSIGTLLDINWGSAGAVGSYNASLDTWMITPNIIMDAFTGAIDAGHELVVIGYDDNAYVYDREGNMNQGLFKVRNSWSKNTGDQGDFYISYDYFNTFVIEMHAIYLKK